MCVYPNHQTKEPLERLHHRSFSKLHLRRVVGVDGTLLHMCLVAKPIKWRGYSVSPPIVIICHQNASPELTSQGGYKSGVDSFF